MEKAYNDKCSNCEAESKANEDDGITLFTCASTDRGAKQPVVRICKKCLEGVLVLKIALAREKLYQPFAFDGYLPVASQR